MSDEPCPVCEGESVYTCGCCPDCGMACVPQEGSTCETRGPVDSVLYDDPIDFDDDSQEDDFDPYED